MTETQSNEQMSSQSGGMSIFAKSLLIITAAMVLIVGVALTVLIKSNNSKETNSLSARGNLVASLQADALAGPIWDFETDGVQALVDALSTDPSFQAAWVLDGKGKELAKSGEVLEKGAFSNFTADILHTEDGKTETIGTLTLQLNHALLNKSSTDQITWGLIASLILLGAILGTVIFILRMIIHPMLDMTSAMKLLASGNHQTDIPALDRGDEVGQMATAVQVFKENAIRMSEI